jgi:hypothetical protein
MYVISEPVEYMTLKQGNQRHRFQCAIDPTYLVFLAGQNGISERNTDRPDGVWAPGARAAALLERAVHGPLALAGRPGGEKISN